MMDCSFLIGLHFHDDYLTKEIKNSPNEMSSDRLKLPEHGTNARMLLEAAAIVREMGEPMLNLKEVLEAHHCLNKDIQIGQRMMTISTMGVSNTIKKLTAHKLQSTLAVRKGWKEERICHIICI